MAKSKAAKRIRSAIRITGLLIVTVFLIGIITTAFCGVAFALYINKYINPNIDVDLDSFRLDFTSFIYCNDPKTGETVELETLYRSENRVWVNYDEIPANMIIAFTSIEDERFFQHNGVDWKRTIGAALSWTGLIGDFTGGGSTITQQLIKNLTSEDETTVERKVQEIMRALNLEKKYEKEDILELYLNTIFLGQNCNGVRTAAEVYFGKELSELTLAECASIAGITKNPSKYNPFRFPKNNKERQETVLYKMHELGKISDEEYEEALKEPLVFKKKENEQKQESKQSYFVDQVISDVLRDLQKEKGYSKELANKLLFSGGLKIYTTINTDIQAKMDEVFTDEELLPGAEGKDGSMPQTAMVLIDPYTGDVVAMYGGRGEKTENRGLNRATQSTRSPGSAIKPLSVYAPALEYGLITPASVFDDVPKDFNVSSKGWPKNYYGAYRGRMTLCKAIEISNNTIPVEVLQKLTPQRSFDFMTTNLGFTTLVSDDGKGNSDINLAPLSLGGLTKGVTVLELTAAYAPFVNDGKYTAPRTYTKVLDATGEVLIDNSPDVTVAMKERTAHYMLDLLQRVVNVSGGTGVRAKIDGISVAAKTGTTTSDYDRWFVGLTPYYIGAVWFGYDSPQEIKGVGSSNPSLVIWKEVMTRVLDGYEPRKFESDEDFVTVSYCMDSGGIPTEWCSHDPRGSRVATVKMAREDAPKNVCTMHVATQVDKVTGRVANEWCPEENLVTVALLNLPRYFPRAGIVVGDQQYVLPYLTAEGEKPHAGFPAVVSSNAEVNYNAVCEEHNALTQPPEEDVPPDGGEEGDLPWWWDPDPEGIDPVETDPIETDPAETDPAETDPAETDPAETGTEPVTQAQIAETQTSVVMGSPFTTKWEDIKWTIMKYSA